MVWIQDSTPLSAVLGETVIWKLQELLQLWFHLDNLGYNAIWYTAVGQWVLIISGKTLVM